MTYPPQEPGSWQDPTRPSESPGSASEQRPQSPSQPAADPYGTMPVPQPGYGSGYPAYPAPGEYPAPPGAYPAPPGGPAGYPVGDQTGYPQPGYPAGYPGYGYGAPPAKTNSLAITSLVLALCGLLCAGLTAPVGAILGHVARRQIRERGEQGAGLALAGIIVGWILTGLLVVYIVAAIIFIVAAQDGGTTTTHVGFTPGR